MIYLKAYQAYQQQNYDQCLKYLREIKQDDTEKLDLLAQVYFKKKEFQKAYDVYQDLIDRGDDFVEERKENVSTLIVCAQLERPSFLKLKDKATLPTTEEIVAQVELINLRDDTVTDVKVETVHTKKVKKNRKRKIRLPKQYDPVAGPDPERWLPRRDRKANAKQKKRRQRPNIKGKARIK